MEQETVTKLQADVNDQIARACEGKIHITWQATAERIAAEELPSDKWEYLWSTSIGVPPQIVITQYLGQE